MGPRGRHRAPSKMSTRVGSAARVTATVAVSGGLVAAVAGPQAAHAEGVAAMSPHAERSAQTTVSTVASKALLSPYRASNHHVINLSVRGTVTPEPKTPEPTQQPTAPETQEPTAPQSRQTQQAQQPEQTQPQQAQEASDQPATRPQESREDDDQTSRSGNRPDPTPSEQPDPPQSTPAPPDPAPKQGGGGASHSSAVAIAKQYIGVPYVFGGTTPSGFDCSGLTQYVYAQLGISLPRTASAQQASLPRVSTPQPGDLVFFGSPAYHVGIYVGDGKMIAAPKPGTTVRLQKIWNTPSGYGRP